MTDDGARPGRPRVSPRPAGQGETTRWRPSSIGALRPTLPWSTPLGARSKRTLLAGLVAVALFVACSGSGRGGGCACSWFGKDAVEEPVATDVEMLGNGSDPRVTLRVARWSGLRYRSTLVVSGSLGFEGGPPVIGPTTSMVVENEVLRGSSEPLVERRHGGVVRLVEERSRLESVTIAQVGVPQAVLDFWNLMLSPVRNTTYLQRVAESAEVVQLNSELLGGIMPPEAVTRAIDGAIEQQRHVPFRLPPSPVGVGARWRFRENVTMNGIRGTQSAEMTLRNVDANEAVVGITLRQEAPPQAISHPLLPGSKATLDAFRGEGSGELVVDRLTAVVLSGNIAVAARSTMTAEAGDKKNTATLVGVSNILMAGTILRDDFDGDTR